MDSVANKEQIERKSRITKRFVDSVNQPGRYFDAELKGFGLKITASGKKIYIVHRRPKGSRTVVTLTIAEHGVITAEQARLEAIKLLARLSAGINPNDERQRREADDAAVRKAQAAEALIQSVTLSRVFQDYTKSRELKAGTLNGYEKVLNRCLGDWLDKPIVLITKDMVEARHDQLSSIPPNTRKKGKAQDWNGQAQANQVMRILRALFNFADEKYQDDTGKSIMVGTAGNPVKRLSKVNGWNRVDRRQSVIKAHELKDWFKRADALANDTMRDYLLLTLFTGLRRNEAASLKWSNIDFKAKTLEIKDTKNKQPHMLPLPQHILELLQERWERHQQKDDRRESLYVFPGGGQTGHLIEAKRAIEQIAKDNGPTFMVHDLRRTFLTIAEGLDISHYALKRLVNHKSGGDVTAGYIVADVERLREPMQKIEVSFMEHMGIETLRKNPVVSNVLALTIPA